jgi:prephenate dehydrogenase
MVAALTTVAALRGQEHFAKAAANGFRDTTRVAEGSPEMWREILAENREAAVASLRRFHEECGRMLAFLEIKDDKGVQDILEEGCRLKKMSLGQKSSA